MRNNPPTEGPSRQVCLRLQEVKRQVNLWRDEEELVQKQTMDNQYKRISKNRRVKS